MQVKVKQCHSMKVHGGIDPGLGVGVCVFLLYYTFLDSLASLVSTLVSR